MSDFYNILIVDDEPDSLEMLSDILTRKGYTVICADSGEYAISLLKTTSPELMLLDINLPGMNGFEVCKSIKENEEYKDLPVIFITGIDDIDKRIEGLKIGAIDFITKPYNRKELLVRIDNIISLTRMKKQLADQAFELSSTNALLQKEILAHKMTEKALEESENRYSTIVNSSPLGILIYNNFWECVFANPAATQLSQLSEELLLTRNLDETDFGKDPGFMDRAKECIGSNSIQKYEICSNANTRKEMWWEIRLIPLIYDDETHLLLIILDITERKLLEQAKLIESEKKYHSILEKSNALISEIDTEGKFLFINFMHKKILGYSPDDLIGKFVFDISLPEDKDAIKARLIEASLPDVTQTSVWKIKDKSNNWRWMNYYAKTYIDESGYTKINIISFDITERILMEEELRKRESQLENALKIGKMAYWEYSIKEDIFTFNDQFYNLFHTDVKNVGSYKISSNEYMERFVYPDDKDMVISEIQKVLATKDPKYIGQSEHRMLYADGSIGFISVRFFIIKDIEGLTVKTYGVNQDITDAKQASEAIKEKVIELERFNNLTIDRELKMIELKNEINLLRIELGIEEKYKIVE